MLVLHWTMHVSVLPLLLHGFAFQVHIGSEIRAISVLGAFLCIVCWIWYPHLEHIVWATLASHHQTVQGSNPPDTLKTGKAVFCPVRFYWNSKMQTCVQGLRNHEAASHVIRCGAKQFMSSKDLWCCNCSLQDIQILTISSSHIDCKGM